MTALGAFRHTCENFFHDLGVFDDAGGFAFELEFLMGEFLGIEVTSADESDQGIDVFKTAIGFAPSKAAVEPGTGGGIHHGHGHVHGMQRDDVGETDPVGW